MDNSFSVTTALCLAAIDIEALLQGQMIAALSRSFISSSQSFALCPASETGETVLVKAWAKPEVCKILTSVEEVEKLSESTIWKNETLQQILIEKGKIFLLGLRVYRLDQLVEISGDRVSSNKVGSFIRLPTSIPARLNKPVLSNKLFEKRQRQLLSLKPFSHYLLAELYGTITQIASDATGVKLLREDIGVYLEWTDHSQQTPEMQPELAWVKEIAALGYRSQELDQGKSNYQAGTDFENIVRQSLEFLGFQIEQAYRGGAGGLDLFCSNPYPLVGECKAGKRIPSGTTEELIKLGGMHLSPDQFLSSAKLIIGPGNPTPDVLKAAQQWKVSIINPMSLQKLAELKVQYPGSIDLLKLEKYLEPGQIDHRINDYIEEVIQNIRIRSHLIKAIKQLADSEPGRQEFEVIEIRVQYNASFARLDDGVLDNQTVYELLIELSSPLAGYLGRVKVSGLNSDRFYFLRDLPLDD